MTSSGFVSAVPLAAVGPPGFPLAESRNGLREVHAEPSHYQWAFGSSGSGYQPGAACVVGAVVTSGMRAPRPSTWFRMPRRIGRHLGSRRCNSRTSSWSAGHPQQRSPPMLSIDTATRSQFGSFVSRLEANPQACNCAWSASHVAWSTEPVTGNWWFRWNLSTALAVCWS